MTKLLDKYGKHKLLAEIHDAELENHVSSANDRQSLLKAVLDTIDATVCVTDPETCKLLFANTKIKKMFGITRDVTGELCHKVFQNFDKRCPFCPYNELKNKPDEIIVWESRETNGMYNRKTALLIDWDNGQKGHMEMGIDITGIATARDSLARRWRLLAEVSNLSITAMTTDAEDMTKLSLSDLANLFDMCGVDRASVWITKGHKFFEPLFCAEAVKGGGAWIDKKWGAEVGNAERAELSRLFHCHYNINKPVNEIPNSEFFKSRGARTLLILPMQLYGYYQFAVVFEKMHEDEPFDDDSEMALNAIGLVTANSVCRDMEEKKRKRAEYYTKMLLQHCPMGCQMWDMEDNLIDCNTATLDLFGVKNMEELADVMYDSFPEFQPSGGRSVEMMAEYRRQAKVTGSASFEWTLLNTQGEIIPLMVNLVCVDNKDEKLVIAYSNDLRRVRALETAALAANVDVLTGAKSRRYFNDVLRQHMELLHTQGDDILGLIMIDIDHFKQYNDCFGHAAGDECLVKIARAIDMCLTRTGEFVARYGGEEFVVVMPNTEFREVEKTAARIHAAVNALRIPQNGGFVTISSGASAFGSKDLVGDIAVDKKRMMEFVDQLLYSAKNSGRNRFIAERPDDKKAARGRRMVSQSDFHTDKLKALAEILIDEYAKDYPQAMAEDYKEAVLAGIGYHDVGKSQIPLEILYKPAKLSAEEFDIIKTHTRTGAQYIMENVPFEKPEHKKIAADMALRHHENYDGSGYPDGVKGEDIPLCARIITLCDVYDALRCQRPYRKALPHSTALSAIINGDERSNPAHFDPKLLEVLKRVESRVAKLYS